MENRAHALAAGIFVIAMGIAAALAFWFFGDRQETDPYLLETRRSVTGLNVQAQVRYRGIRAGKVESIEQDPADPRIILVKIGVDPRFRLTRSAVAKLGYQGVTGLAYVEIEDDGSDPQPLTTDENRPARLPLRPGLMETLSERAGDIATQVGDVSARLARLLDEKNTANLARTVDNLAATTDAMRAALSRENLKRLDAILAQVDKTSAEAAPLTAEIRGLVKSMTATSDKLDRLMGGAGDMSATGPQIGALAKRLNENSIQLGRILDMLEERPQALLFGPGARPPGPGEAGFVPPTEK